MTAAVDKRRSSVHTLTSRRGLASVPARLALRGRHVAELTHQLRRAIVAIVAVREREFRTTRLALEARDLRRRLTAIHGRLDTAAGRLHSGIERRRDRAAAQLGASVARLESLSPLAVLGRGYSVCWNEDRTAIIRRAATVKEGERVHVTLQEGALSCLVQDLQTDRDAQRTK